MTQKTPFPFKELVTSAVGWLLGFAFVWVVWAAAYWWWGR